MKFKNIFFFSLGALVFVIFILVLFLLFTKQIPDQNKDLVNIGFGSLISCVTSVVQYFYGSSSGSREKTELLANKNL